MRNRVQRRTDTLDMSEEAHRELVERLRELTPEQRLQMTLELTAAGMAEERATRELQEEQEPGS